MEDERIFCVCMDSTDIGLMVQCDSCKCWLHAHCVNFKTADDVPEHYVCPNCKSKVIYNLPTILNELEFNTIRNSNIQCW